MLEYVLFTIIFLLSLLGVEFFRRWSVRRSLLDIPNERSSHTTPTPRGGGLIIVVVSLIAYTVHSIFIAETFSWGYLLGAIFIAVVSWLDDLYSIPSFVRFFIHSVAALLVITTLGYFQEIAIPFTEQIELGSFGIALTFFWIVWLTNAYNFMDGIDGIAGMQAITAGIGWLIIGTLLNLNAVEFYGGVIAFSSLGFLIQNWQPAKIFMGDVGSAFLGYSFAVMPLLAKSETNFYKENSAYLPLVAILLVWLFVFDTIVTFLKRILKGEKVWQAHRSHIYQKLVQAGHTHRAITTLYGLMSILTLLILLWWIVKKEETQNFSSMLLIFLGLQSFGLLIYSYYKEKTAVSV